MGEHNFPPSGSTEPISSVSGSNMRDPIPDLEEDIPDVAGNTSEEDGDADDNTTKPPWKTTALDYTKIIFSVLGILIMVVSIVYAASVVAITLPKLDEGLEDLGKDVQDVNTVLISVDTSLKIAQINLDSFEKKLDKIDENIIIMRIELGKVSSDIGALSRNFPAQSNNK